MTPPTQILEARELWAKRLETTDAPQTTGHLARDEARCCLGVACDLAIEQGVIRSYSPHGGTLPREVLRWLGLGIGKENSESYFIILNDNRRLPFSEIAKKVRAMDQEVSDGD